MAVLAGDALLTAAFARGWRHIPLVSLLYCCAFYTWLLMGAALITYYMSFGIFYDADSFILTTFGKKSVVYRFADIRAQQLYTIQGGGVLVELHMADGRTVSIQSAMEGAYPFLDHAFAAWCRQTGRDPESCGFHDPSQSLWFPTEEG